MATNTIRGKGPYQQEELYASEAGIYPGMLLKRNTAGKVAIHTTEGGALGDEVLIAAEDALQGKTIADVYTVDTIVTCILPGKGSTVNVLIEDAQNVATSNKLISAGNGKFKVSTDIESGETLAHIPGVATEDCDLTGSDTDDTLCEMCVV